MLSFGFQKCARNFAVGILEASWSEQRAANIDLVEGMPEMNIQTSTQTKVSFQTHVLKDTCICVRRVYVHFGHDP